jgi:hypothetical protein
MLKLILLVPATVLLVLGSEGLFYAARGRHEAVVTCEEFARARPSSVRVRVTGCEPDFAHAAYRESGLTLEELFLPVRPAGQPTRPASIVVATSDPAALAIAQRVLGKTATSDQSLAAMKRVADYLGLSIAVDGVVRAGVIERLRSRRILSGLADSVAADAVVVDLRATPDLMRPSLAVAAGLALAAVVWLLMRRRAATQGVGVGSDRGQTGVRPGSDRGQTGVRPGSDPLENAPDPLVSEPTTADSLAIAEDQAGVRPGSDWGQTGVRPGSDQGQTGVGAGSDPRHGHGHELPRHEPRVTVMLPKLLLLNVDVLAGPEAVESAPPLGTRVDVGTILSGVIPDLEFTKGTRVLARPDGSITLDLGTQDTVATVVAEVHGQAGVALIKELMMMTGWRAFAPKTGLFVSTDDLESLAALATELKESSQLPAASSPRPDARNSGSWKPEAGS